MDGRSASASICVSGRIGGGTGSGGLEMYAVSAAFRARISDFCSFSISSVAFCLSSHLSSARKRFSEL